MEDEELSTVSIYNIGILNTDQIKRTKPAGSGSAGCESKSSLKYNSSSKRMRRPLSGKTALNTRPQSGNSSTVSTADHSALLLTGYSGFKEHYIPSGYAPAGYAPDGYTPDGYAPAGYAPEGYNTDGYRYDDNNPEMGADDYPDLYKDTETKTGYSQVTGHGYTGTHAPCSTPDILADINPTDYYNSNRDENIREESVSKQHLSLALPGVEDSISDDNSSDDEQIPTLRLLDGIQINLKGGRANVNFTPEVKIKLTSGNQHIPLRDEKISAAAAADQSNHSTQSKTIDERRVEMEEEIKSLLSHNTWSDFTKLRKFTEISNDESNTNAADESLLRESRECWNTETVGNDDSTDEIQNPQEILNDCIDENHQTDQSLHSGEQHHLSVDIKNSQTVDNICKRADSLSLSEQPFYSAVVGQPGFSRELQASPEDSNPKSPNRPTPAQESFLYKWQINVSNPNNQVADVSVPLINKHRDYDAMDSEIDSRVEEIERQLAQQIVESQNTINRLQQQADATEFRIPKFCELESETASDTGRASQTPHELLLQAQAKAEAQVRAHSRAGSRLDYNVVQQHQANKLGLKNRDYTQVFQAVAPRFMKKKKYAPATTGKVNLANVKSRINSGVSRGGGSLSRNKETDQHSGEGTDQAGGKADLILRGNTRPKIEKDETHTNNKNGNTEIGIYMLSRSNQRVSNAMAQPDKPHSGKVIKTFTLSQGVQVVEEKTVSDLTEKCSDDKYQMPEHVKAHMDRCVNKPPKSSTKRETIAPSSKTQTSQRQLNYTVSHRKTRPNSASHSQQSKSNNISPHTDMVQKTTNPSTRVKSATSRRLGAPPEGRVLQKRERSEDQRLYIASRTRQQPDNETAVIHRHTDRHTKYRQGSDDILTTMAMIDSEDIIGGSEICDYTEQEAHNEQQGGLSVNASTQPISGHDTDYTKLEPTHHVKAGQTRPASRRVQSAPVTTRRVQSAPVKRNKSKGTIITPYNHIERDDCNELESIDALYDRVTSLGAPVHDKSILDRALYPPPSQAIKSCQQQFSSNFHSAGLLSSPHKWLKEEYEKVKLARHKVTRYEKINTERRTQIDK